MNFKTFNYSHKFDGTIYKYCRCDDSHEELFIKKQVQKFLFHYRINSIGNCSTDGIFDIRLK